jgi:hypothetical protein
MTKQQLYQLIIAQLRDDGFLAAAQTVSLETVVPSPKDVPKYRLEKVCAHLVHFLRPQSLIKTFCSAFQLVKLGLSVTQDNDVDGMDREEEDEHDTRVSTSHTRENIDHSPDRKLRSLLMGFQEQRNQFGCCTTNEDRTTNLRNEILNHTQRFMSSGSI